MSVPRNGVDWAVIAVSTLGTLTSVVVAASQQRPASAIALMIAIGCAALGGAALTWTRRAGDGSLRVRARWRIASSAACLLVVAAMVVTPLAPGTGRPVRHHVLGFSDAGYDVRIQGISVAQSKSGYRTSLAVLNDAASPYVIDRLGLRVDFVTMTGVNGCHDQGASYRFTDVINVTRTEDPKRQKVEGTAKGSDEYAYTTTGSLHEGCVDGSLEFSVDVGIALPAKQSVNVDLEFPKTFRVVDVTRGFFGDGGRAQPTLTLPVEKGRTLASKHAEGTFSVSLGVGDSTVSRDHSVPAEIRGFQ